MYPLNGHLFFARQGGMRTFPNSTLVRGARGDDGCVRDGRCDGDRGGDGCGNGDGDKSDGSLARSVRTRDGGPAWACMVATVSPWRAQGGSSKCGISGFFSSVA
jgi:hypothetical protein